MIECIEQLLLHLFSAGDQVQIIQQKKVGISVFLPKIIHFLTTDTVNEIIEKLLCGQIDHIQFRMSCFQFPPYSLEQMRFPRTRNTVDDKGIEGTPRHFSDRTAGPGRQQIPFPCNKGFKLEFKIRFIALHLKRRFFSRCQHTLEKRG